MTDAEANRIVITHAIVCIVILGITCAAAIGVRDIHRAVAAVITGVGLCFLVIAHAVMVAAGVL